MSAIRYLAATVGCAVLLGLAVTGFVRKQLSLLEAAAVTTRRPPQTRGESSASAQQSEVCTTASNEVALDVPSDVSSDVPSRRASKDRPARVRPTKRPSKPKGSRQVERGSFLDELGRGTKQVGEGRYEIERRALDLALDNLALLSGAVRVAPEIRDGKAVGFRLFAIAADGPFAQLGLRDEDVLVSINHLDIATAEQVLEAYGKLKTARHLVLGVLRGGRKVSLEYTIR